MGKREKFIYNIQTLRFEKVEISWLTTASRALTFLSSAVFNAFLFSIVLYKYFPSPKEKILLQEIEVMKTHYDKVVGDLQTINEEMKHLNERDAYAYRTIFGMNPVDENVWEGGVGGHDEFLSLRDLKHGGASIIHALEKVRKLKHKMVVQSKSLDTIINLANAKENMLASLPSIKPVRSDKLSKMVGLLSGFGYRIHPVYKVPRMHYGLDFTAPKGTPIQATGDGVVKKAEYHSGYGKCVIISHGYGYETLYAHMSSIEVRAGQKVKRGHQLGKVGSTGTSTAPHCHYEVHLKGKQVNPIHYVMDGLSPKEYQSLVKAAEGANQSMD
ncbi:MAG TPA: M23 family metallopeptidase [Haliscomenobacter sp.]|nr:M23 family metallopeptidase [Haliscomenobacter sp.]